VFVINLDRDTTRMAAISKHLLSMGASFERWPATDGAAFKTSADSSCDIEIRGFGPWAAGEIGCGVSHIRIWQHIVQHRLRWAIVLEDDARLCSPLPAAIEDWDLPPDADIVLLNDRSLPGPARHRGRRFAYGDVTGGAGTDGYLVSRAGAQKLLAATRPLSNPLDFQMYAHFKSIQTADRYPYFWRLPRNRDARHIELVAYRILPALITHPGTDSTIGNWRHPRARFYCRTLLGVNYDTDGDHAARAYGASYYAGISYLAGGHPVSPPKAPSVDEPARRGRNAPARPAPFYRGVDISHCHEDDARSTAAILADHGVNSVRLSVWVGDESAMSPARVLRMAKAAADHGLQIYLALHYSDTWADPGRQDKPRAWRRHGIGQLIDEVHSYTRNLVETFYRHDVPLAIIQLGNEITNGLLWAEDSEDERTGGRLHPPEHQLTRWQADDQWIVIAELLKAADAGVVDGLPAGEHVRTMLHLDRGADIDGALWWLDKSTAVGITSDLIGLSFYGMWHDGATIANLGRMRKLHERYPHRPVVLSETAYPYRPFTDDLVKDLSIAEFPLTPAGQQRYLEAALSAVGAVPNCAGLFWWGACFTDSRVAPCIDKFRAHALFDADGRPLPALRAFRGAREANGRD
jgi:arabinogalactan endo-1,4-beta-galactosidase